MAIQKMSGFVETAQEMPSKRQIQTRLRDFREIYQRFDPCQAQTQARRCAQCGIPFCQIHCPVHNNIPDWLKLAAEGRFQEAYERSAETNNFPEICGRICPQDRLCEGNCVIQQADHGAVTIGEVENFLSEYAFENGWVKPVTIGKRRPESIGIIGAGAAGLSAAEILRGYGYQVTVYDRYDQAGGLLIYGIPEFKLEKSVIHRRVKRLEEAEIDFQLNCDVGVTVSFQTLQKKHQAVLIATGAYCSQDLEVENPTLKNIHFALPYLIANNDRSQGKTVADFDRTFGVTDRRVVVLGGGETAMDCVRTAVRQKPRSVVCLYRRDQGNMPGSSREFYNADEEGVSFIWKAIPQAFIGQESVQGMRTLRVQLGPPDASGRRLPQIIPDSHDLIDCDIVIKALGFTPEDTPRMFGLDDLKLGNSKRIVVDPKTMMTNLEGVFAAGDVVRGADLVVWAIRQGRDAAQGIYRYLQRRS